MAIHLKSVVDFRSATRINGILSRAQEQELADALGRAHFWATPGVVSDPPVGRTDN